MYDGARIALWVGAAAAILAVGCLVYLVSQNLGSRNIAIASGTVAGAAILLAIQLLFKLRIEENTDFITAEFTIDRAKPAIRQLDYCRTPTLRASREFAASETFAAAHPGQFNVDRDKLTHDMVIFSLLSYLGVEQFDWQMKRTQFVGQSESLISTVPGSTPEECTTITKDQLRKMLSDAGNSFADADMFFFGPDSLCLPPRSTLQVTADRLALTNPFCEILFTLQPSGGISFGLPGVTVDKQAVLPNGEPQFET